MLTLHYLLTICVYIIKIHKTIYFLFFFFKVNESNENEQVEKENIKIQSCEQICTNCKCKLTDIEDFVDATVSEKDSTEFINVQQIDSSEELNEIEEEKESKEIDSEEEVEHNTINEVSISFIKLCTLY